MPASHEVLKAGVAASSRAVCSLIPRIRINRSMKRVAGALIEPRTPLQIASKRVASRGTRIRQSSHARMCASTENEFAASRPPLAYC